MKKKRTVLILVTLYLVTWIGGYFCHTREMRKYVQELYDNAKKQDERTGKLEQQFGQPYNSDRIHIRSNGPISRVRWIIPVLPCILLSNSEYIIGPLFGSGGMKLIFYYGYGTVSTPIFWGWVS